MSRSDRTPTKRCRLALAGARAVVTVVLAGTIASVGLVAISDQAGAAVGYVTDSASLVNPFVGTVILATLIAAEASLGGTSSVAAAPASPPRSPKSVQAVAGNRSATVSWQAPASSGSGGIDRYRVTSRPGSRHCTTTGPTTCTVRGLANGAPYTFTVAAQVAAGWSEPSSPSPPAVPGVPVDGHLLYPGADLAGAGLSGADLQHVDIEGADLKGANLSGANLADADLLDVDLSGSTLTRAMFSGADLKYANLYDSNLSGADLEKADLNGATMTGVTSGSISTVPAELPFGFRVVDGYLAGPSPRTPQPLLTMHRTCRA